MIRITGGQFKNKKLKSPTDDTIRPASDFIRQMVFNIVQHAAWSQPMAQYQVLDLFCGTGVYGLEALSRGAVHAQFIDQHIRLAQDNAALCGVQKAVFQTGTLPRKLVVTGLPALVFIDPPYGQDLIVKCLKQLTLPAESLVIVESEKTLKIAPVPNYAVLDERVSGVTKVLFLRYEPTINQGEQDNS